MAAKHRTKFYMVRLWVKEAYDSPPMQEPPSPPPILDMLSRVTAPRLALCHAPWSHGLSRATARHAGAQALSRDKGLLPRADQSGGRGSAGGRCWCSATSSPTSCRSSACLLAASCLRHQLILST